jgi:hypothetical protein
MPIHIPIQDNSEEQKIDVRTPGQKRRDTIKKTRPDFYPGIGSKGGKNSTNRPFKDPEAARRAANARWGKKDDERP